MIGTKSLTFTGPLPNAQTVLSYYVKEKQHGYFEISNTLYKSVKECCFGNAEHNAARRSDGG